MALFFLLVLSLCIPFNQVDAKNGHERHHSLHRSREVKSTLRLTRDNEFECVDIYKQLAFDHPLLKNHKIQRYPTFTRDRMQSKSSHVKKVYTISSFNKGCPPGKVPNNRKQTRHQMGSKTSSEPRLRKFSQYSQLYPNHHFATLDTTPNTTYRGAAAGMNAYNLSLQDGQYSLAQIWLQSGPPNANLNSIQAGWGVHPSMYGDSLARLTGYWTTDNFQKTGCFNKLCPGFVQIHPNHSFGGLLTPVGGGSPSEIEFEIKIMQDQTSGHWWLTVADDFQIGYWPKELLTNLGQGASLIRYGGETFSPPNMNSPPMGSGKLAEAKFGNSGFFDQIKFADSQFELNDVSRKDMNINCDTSPNCYDLLYTGYQGKEYGQAFLYGGPGGQCGT